MCDLRYKWIYTTNECVSQWKTNGPKTKHFLFTMPKDLRSGQGIVFYL